MLSIPLRIIGGALLNVNDRDALVAFNSIKDYLYSYYQAVNSYSIPFNSIKDYQINPNEIKTTNVINFQFH